MSAGRIISVVEDEFLARETGDAAARSAMRTSSARRRHDVALPAAPHHRVAAVHQEAVAGVGGLDEIVDRPGCR